MDVNYWVIAKKAAMIFVPVVDQKISKEIFYCSLCKSWLKISNSFKNIRRHIFVHIPNFDDGNGDNDDDSDNENEGKMTNLKKKKKNIFKRTRKNNNQKYCFIHFIQNTNFSIY